jgi:MTH538 TIR-like domain (DUF1863)
VLLVLRLATCPRDLTRCGREHLGQLTHRHRTLQPRVSRAIDRRQPDTPARSQTGPAYLNEGSTSPHTDLLPTSGYVRLRPLSDVFGSHPVYSRRLGASVGALPAVLLSCPCIVKWQCIRITALSLTRRASSQEGIAARVSGYDAFLSYGHALDGELAPTLQRELERFAKSWYKMRSLRVFRDDANLSASPGLWSSIEEALAVSEWLVLVASPKAARSPWVGREISWWLANRSPQRLLIVVTSGNFVWDDQAQDVNWEASTAVPPSLRGAFHEEPRWVDLRWLRDVGLVDRSNPRLQECVANIGATIRNTPKDVLVGEHIRQHRRTMRVAHTAVTTLVVLLILAVASGAVAVVQRNEARNQAKIVTARQLAANAVTQLGANLNLAQLLAVEAYRMDRSPQTRSALFQAVTASPNLVRQRPLDSPVTALTGSANGQVAVAGTSTGRLVRWDVTRNVTSEVAVGEKEILDISVTADGRRIVATDGSRTVLWDVASGEQPMTIGGGPVQMVAISPSGRLIATYAHPVRVGGWQDAEDDSPAILALLDGLDGHELRDISPPRIGVSWD